jgi:hypothetical protein
MSYTVGFVSKLRNFFFLSVFRNFELLESNLKYTNHCFRVFSVTGQYFPRSFQTVYPIEENNTPLESCGLGVTFLC